MIDDEPDVTFTIKTALEILGCLKWMRLMTQK